MTDDREKAVKPASSAQAAREAPTASSDQGRRPGAGPSEEGQRTDDGERQQASAGAATEEMTVEERALADLADIDFGVKKSIRYHARRRAFYERAENFVNVLVAVTGASAFAVLIGGEGKTATFISGAVAILALVSAVLGLGRRAREHQDLYRRFSELAIEIAMLEHPSGRDIARLRAKRLSLEAEEPHIIDALERQCWNEEAEARGTPRSELQPLSWFQRVRLRFI